MIRIPSEDARPRHGQAAWRIGVSVREDREIEVGLV